MMKIITAMSILSLIALTGTAYALEDENGNVLEVEVNTFPFEITLVEEGTVIITSEIDRVLRSDVFTIEVKAGEPYSLVLDPILDSTNNDGWYVQDLASGEYSIIRTVDFYVPAPEPIYVPEPVFVPEPVIELIVEEVVEPTPEINFGAVSSETIGSFETISNSTFVEPIIVEPIIVEPMVIEPTGIQNVATYEGEVDLITMQTKLAEVTLSFNESIQKIADQKQQLEAINVAMTTLKTDRESLSSQVISLQANTTAIDIKDNQISVLEANIVSLTSDRDQWKALANNWYGVAMSQLEVMVNVLGL